MKSYAAKPNFRVAAWLYSRTMLLPRGVTFAIVLCTLTIRVVFTSLFILNLAGGLASSLTSAQILAIIFVLSYEIPAAYLLFGVLQTRGPLFMRRLVSVLAFISVCGGIGLSTHQTITNDDTIPNTMLLILAISHLDMFLLLPLYRAVVEPMDYDPKQRLQEDFVLEERPEWQGKLHEMYLSMLAQEDSHGRENNTLVRNSSMTVHTLRTGVVNMLSADTRGAEHCSRACPGTSAAK